MKRVREGFTLIELLVVVAIIALLISILLPALSAAKEQARTAVCASNERNMGLALIQYTDEYDHYPGEHKTVWRDSVFGWAPRLRKLMNDNEKLFWCPTSDSAHRWQKVYGYDSSRFDATVFGYEPGEEPLNWQRFFTYAYNGWGEKVFTYDGDDGDGSPDEKIMYGLGGHIDEGGWAEPHVREVVRPEDMIAIADSFADGLGDGGMVPHFRSTRQWPSKRHNGAAVVLFCDGHAVRMFLEDLVAEDDVVRRRWNNDHQSHREYWQDPDR
jgi:prepilin-type N-terminal cleavage/methylation domain-containing protein/prepilin-type processing-associated H-X9-DG protein